MENLALARAALAAQEGLVPLIECTGLWQFALDGVYWLVRQEDLTTAEALRLQSALTRDRDVAVAALRRAFRGEFTFMTRVLLERLPRTRDVEVLLSTIGTLGQVSAVAPPEGEPRLASPPDGIDPLDREAALRAAAEDVAVWLTALGGGRHPRGLQARQTTARLVNYAREISALLRYATQHATATPAQIAAADVEIGTVSNSVGKCFLVITTPRWEPLSEMVFRREAQRRALIGLLAWHRHGHPASWDELVDAKLLKAGPEDPFSNGEEMRVDLHEPRIWSVGVDGDDDGGRGDGENIGMPPDFVWPLSGE